MNSKLALYFRILALSFAVVLNACQHQRVWDNRTPSVPFAGRGQTGFASWYGDQFNGKKTASGEVYDMYAMTAAHRTAPFGTKVRVTNLDNAQQTVVTINDRGPFVRGRIIDLSKKAAMGIGMIGSGTAKVRLDFLETTIGRATLPTPERIPSPPAVITPQSIYIQVASFESKENASMYVFDFQRTMPSITARIYSENGLYRIRTGPYSNEEDAQRDLATLKKANFSCFVLHPR